MPYSSAHAVRGPRTEYPPPVSVADGHGLHGKTPPLSQWGVALVAFAWEKLRRAVMKGNTALEKVSAKCPLPSIATSITMKSMLTTTAAAPAAGSGVSCVSIQLSRVHVPPLFSSCWRHLDLPHLQSPTTGASQCQLPQRGRPGRPRPHCRTTRTCTRPPVNHHQHHRFTSSPPSSQPLS